MRSFARRIASYIGWPLLGFTVTAVLAYLGVPVHAVLALAAVILATDWAITAALRAWRRRTLAKETRRVRCR